MSDSKVDQPQESSKKPSEHAVNLLRIVSDSNESHRDKADWRDGSSGTAEYWQKLIASSSKIEQVDYAKIAKDKQVLTMGDYMHYSNGVKNEFSRALKQLVPHGLSDIGLEGLTRSDQPVLDQYVKLKQQH